jgi:uncharacterized protein HemX
MDSKQETEMVALLRQIASDVRTIRLVVAIWFIAALAVGLWIAVQISNQASTPF